jgi:hypothetical protein
VVSERRYSCEANSRELGVRTLNSALRTPFVPCYFSGLASFCFAASYFATPAINSAAIGSGVLSLVDVTEIKRRFMGCHFLPGTDSGGEGSDGTARRWSAVSK